MTDPIPYDDSKVTCEICKKQYRLISPLHLKTHNTTMAQYRLRYPDAPLVSKGTRDRMKVSLTESIRKSKVKEVDIGETENHKDDIVEEEVKIEEPEVEEIIVEEEVEEITPVVEEETFSLKKDNLDKIIRSKEEILDILLTYFSNVKMDYLIRKLNLTNNLIYEHITDFCDPVLKVVIDFPNTFFHNTDRYVNLARDATLENDGWKIIKIKNLSNIRKQLDKELY